MDDIQMIPVDSSNIESIGYDKESRTLRIDFKSGNRWEYSDVPENVFNGLSGAASKGRYFTGNIRGAYTGREV